MLSALLDGSFFAAAWPALGAAGAAGLLFALLGGRIYALRRNNERLRNVFRASWENYLEAVAVSIERLKNLRAAVARVRPAPHQEELGRAAQAFFDRVRAEILAIEEQLDRMALAEDADWFRMPIDWRPVADLSKESQRLFALAAQAVSEKDLERLRAEWTRDIEARFKDEIERLTAKGREYQARIEELEARLQEASDAGEAGEKRVQELTARVGELEQALAEAGGAESGAASGEPEEAIAARLMARLEDGLPADQIAARMAAADGETHFCREQMRALPEDDPKRAEFEARAAWSEQTRRWWTHLQTLARKTALLDEVTGRASEMEAEAGERTREQMGEFQNVEARNAELRGKIVEMQTTNRNLTRQLEDFNREKATNDQLRNMLQSVDAARKNSERELAAVEEMTARMEDDLVRLRAESKRLAKADAEAVRTAKQLVDAQARVKALEEQAELARHRAEMQEGQAADEAAAETQRLKRELDALKKKMADGDLDGYVPEAEAMEIQQAYDALNAQILQMRSARVQAERGEKAEHEAREKLQSEHKHLLEKHQELRGRLAAALQEVEQLHKAPTAKTEPAKGADSEELEALRMRRDQDEALIEQLRADASQTRKALAEERARFEREIAAAREASPPAGEEAPAPAGEEELEEMRGAFDELSADFVEADEARKRAEAAREAAEKNLAKTREELQALQRSYREIRDEFAGLMRKPEAASGAATPPPPPPNEPPPPAAQA